MALLVRPSWRLRILVLVVAVGIASGGAVLWSRTIADDGDNEVVLDQPGEFIDPSVTNPEHDGSPLPAFELSTVGGGTVELVSDGRPMVVNVWFSTCPPCARELAAFAEVEDEFGERLRFVGVNPVDTADTMLTFAADRGVDYELFMDSSAEVVNGLGLLQFPVTLFVSADGEILTQTGALNEAELRAHVAELLA